MHMSVELPENAEDQDVARRLIEKLRVFIADELTQEEGSMLAALVAPGISLAYAEDEVSGFGAHWGVGALPQALAKALQDSEVRVEGLQD
jgi:hypothetical protein